MIPCGGSRPIVRVPEVQSFKPTFLTGFRREESETPSGQGVRQYVEAPDRA